MNLIDWIIVGILGLSVLVGLYRGFISSVASMGGCLVSLGASYFLTPQVVDYLTKNTSLADTIASYTGATKLAGDMAGTSVAGLTSEQIAGAVQQINLPPPLDRLLESNLANQAYRSVADVTQNVGGYVAQTIVVAVMSIICFILTFVVLTILFHILINLLNAIFKFPVLKQLNSVAGGVFGLLRGALLCFVAFALLPLFQTLIPDNVNALVAGSTLAPIFNSNNLILSIMKGSL